MPTKLTSFLPCCSCLMLLHHLGPHVCCKMSICAAGSGPRSLQCWRVLELLQHLRWAFYGFAGSG